MLSLNTSYSDQDLLIVSKNVTLTSLETSNSDTSKHQEKDHETHVNPGEQSAENKIHSRLNNINGGLLVAAAGWIRWDVKPHHSEQSLLEDPR